MFYSCQLPPPTGHVSISYQSSTSFPPMWVAACWMSLRWAWPTQHAPLDSSSCLPLLLIFLPAFLLLGGGPSTPLQACKLLFVLLFCIHKLSLANVSLPPPKKFLSLVSPLLLYPSLGFRHPPPGLVKESSNGFIGMQLFLLMLPMPLPVTSHSSCCLATLTHPLRLSSGIHSGTLPSPYTYPQESFSVSLVTLCLSVITCEME